MSPLPTEPYAEARDFRERTAALRAARATDPYHGHLLLLASDPGDLAVLPAAGCLRTLDDVRLARELHRVVPAARVLQDDSEHDRVLGGGQPDLAVERAPARGDGRQTPAGGRRLSHFVDLALRRRAGGRRCSLVVHASSIARDGGARNQGTRDQLESAARRHRRDGNGRSRRRLEADLIQLPVLFGGPRRDSA